MSHEGLCVSQYRSSVNFFYVKKIIKKTNGVCVQQFELSYIGDATHTPHKNWVKLCREVHYMLLVNQDSESQE